MAANAGWVAGAAPLRAHEFASIAAAALPPWLQENMLEVECPAVTPEIVLKASGHVERFTDFMVGRRAWKTRERGAARARC